MRPQTVGAQSSAARTSAEAAIDALIDRMAPSHRQLVADARRLLRNRVPTAHELVYEYRDWFVISFAPSDRGYEGVLAIRGSASGIKLYFNQGKGLPDPTKRLRGSGTQARFIALESKETLAEPEVVALLDVAIARNPVPFADAGKGHVIVRGAKEK